MKSSPRKPSNIKTNYQQKHKILYVGDSVGHSANLRIVEKSQKCRIRSARAYSSVFDRNAKWPAKNFKDVVDINLKNPGNEDYETLIMTSPTVDISNLDADIEQNILEERIATSSKNMVSIGEKALVEHKMLKKVIIMEHPPRFDGRNSHLVQVANNVLRQIHAKSPYKDRIVVGQHSLECTVSGSTHMNRYRDNNTGRYDGVHMYGRTGMKDYTDSVNSILLMAFPEDTPVHSPPRAELGKEDHTWCEQAQYQYQQWRQAQIQNNKHRGGASQHRYGQSSYHGPQYIPTHNRFNIFNQGNY